MPGEDMLLKRLSALVDTFNEEKASFPNIVNVDVH